MSKTTIIKPHRKTKKEKIRAYLLTGKSLTAEQAVRLFSAYRLADVIYKMKKREGLNIQTTLIPSADGTHYAEYKIIS